MKYLYITNNLDITIELDKIGLDMVWIDLEKNGKNERQKNMDTVKSEHFLEDIKKISPHLKKAKLLVRINPIFDGSLYEINKAIEYGADCIMLPMFKTKQEVEEFYKIIDNRCDTILLLETKEAVENLDKILEIKEIKNVHIGLNDLSISYKYPFMFEPLSNGIVEKICLKLKEKNIEYGFGGIARLGEGNLSANLILSEHVRLGSNRVILSRSFCKFENFSKLEEFSVTFSNELKKLKLYREELLKLDKKELLKNKELLETKIQEITSKL